MEKIILNHSSAAIDNLTGGFERLNQLRAIFLASFPAKPADKAAAIGLLDKALRCTTAALSELKTISLRLIDAAAAPTIEGRKFVTDSKKRRKRIQSWTIATTEPHFDGHQWRKYGQKRIHNSVFPRSYYKCSQQKEQGCPATKTIQQMEGKIYNPPLYQVSYSMQHTCKPKELTQEISIPIVMDSSKTIISNTSSTTTASSTHSCQPLALPLQAEETERVCLMEPMLCSSEPTEDLSKRSPLATLDFDWEWHDELILLKELWNGIV